MRAEQSKRFTNISATTAAFQLYGGNFRVLIVATFGGGNCGLEQLGPDGTTWLPSHVAATTNSINLCQPPPGTFRFRITTATAVFVDIVRMPGE